MESLVSIYDGLVAEGRIHDDAAQRMVLPVFERIRNDLQAPAPKRGLFRKAAPVAVRGLYLWGGVGRGKSMIMDLFAAHTGVPTRRVHFHAFMQEVQDALHAARKSGAEDAIQPVAKDIAEGLRLLAFDEMQITDITDAMIVGRLFEALFEAGVTVVTTSNRPPKDLYKDGLNRQLFLPFISLLEERLEVIELDGPKDHRQNRLGGGQVYFTPDGPESRARISQIWQELTGGEDAPLTFTVKGRPVELPAFHNGAARASFYDLCAKNLGPADYLELARLLRLLVLEDIPRLSRRNFNEAKRFVTLIDALYEAKVRLIASAAAEPEMLYVEGEGSFEFERTASRLREMQASDWGQDG